ncbi:hypothetical protein [Rubripirellula reticaptiva]|uniref:Uncharacterized protein n=1 Tax=Rubripirellula reticaptiva TaxID=2528013 RepID=A0A5C6ET06_9BACT|nr:hypothetical protein [Rubripirellula reticaptiva]TWU51504.1 hypothetical protein Poly59_30960 [Rubripirellula reticaptiva]
MKKDTDRDSIATHCSAALCHVESVRKENPSLALRMQRICEAYDKQDFESTSLLNDAFALAFQIGQMIEEKHGMD